MPRLLRRDLDYICTAQVEGNGLLARRFIHLQLDAIQKSAAIAIIVPRDKQ